MLDQDLAFSSRFALSDDPSLGSSEGAKLGQQAIEAASKEAGKGGVGGVSSSTPRETAKPPASGSAANEQILSEMLEEGTVIKRKKPKDESK